MNGQDAHIKSLRLFELSQKEMQHSSFTLTPEEQKHFDHCAECQHVVSVFARQFSRHRPPNDLPEDVA